MTTKQLPFNWVPLIASVAIALVGWIANAATVSAKASSVDERLTAFQARYEREVVPRAELEAKDKAQEFRFNTLDSHIDKLQNTLDDVAKYLRSSRK